MNRLRRLAGQFLPALLLFILPLFFSPWFGTETLAQVYRWVDNNGQVNFSDYPPADNRNQAEQVEVRINSYQGVQIEDTQGPAENNSASRSVVMYSASWCVVCKRARTWFRKKQIAFTEYDVETSRKGRRDYKKLNGRGVPIIMVGTKRLNGFTEQSFNQIYHRNG